MTIVTVHNVGVFSQLQHEVKGSFLQENIHGKVIKMTLPLSLPVFFQLVFFSVGIHAAFIGKPLCLDKKEVHAMEFPLPNCHRLPPLFFDVVHI